MEVPKRIQIRVGMVEITQVQRSSYFSPPLCQGYQGRKGMLHFQFSFSMNG